MTVDLELPNPARHCWHLKRVEVVYVTRRSPDSWLVGSCFAQELTSEELQGLLREPPQERCS
jgi:hypothetical protein